MPDRIPLLYTEQGWKVNGVNAWLDPAFPVQTAIISHAHGDHAVSGHRKVYCTPETAKILTVRYRKFAWEVITPQWEEPFEIEGTVFRFYPAGHMLGAAQVYWERNDERIVYTGDFHPASNPTCHPYQKVDCDVLITETTFAQFGRKHPDAAGILKDQLKVQQVNYVIGTYVVGKAQRLNRLISELLPQFQVMVHPKIIPYHHAYTAAGFSPGNWTPFHRQQFKRQRDIIYLVPPQVLAGLPLLPYTRRGFASGWIEKQEGNDLQLPISDHADWFDLVNTIETSGARKVYTLHGDGSELANYFRDKLPVLPLEA